MALLMSFALLCRAGLVWIGNLLRNPDYPGSGDDFCAIKIPISIRVVVLQLRGLKGHIWRPTSEVCAISGV
jgi:hypothetical protein